MTPWIWINTSPDDEQHLQEQSKYQLLLLVLQLYVYFTR